MDKKNIIATINSDDWHYAVSGTSAIFVGKNDPSDEVIILEGEKIAEFLEALGRGVKTEGNPLLQELLNNRILRPRQRVNGDDCATENMATMGFKVKLSKVRLNELFPREIRTLTLTAGDNQQVASGNCAVCTPITGCQYEVKLRCLTASVPLQDKTGKVNPSLWKKPRVKTKSRINTIASANN